MVITLPLVMKQILMDSITNANFLHPRFQQNRSDSHKCRFHVVSRQSFQRYLKLFCCYEEHFIIYTALFVMWECSRSIKCWFPIGETRKNVTQHKTFTSSQPFVRRLGRSSQCVTVMRWCCDIVKVIHILHSESNQRYWQFSNGNDKQCDNKEVFNVDLGEWMCVA